MGSETLDYYPSIMIRAKYFLCDRASAFLSKETHPELKSPSNLTSEVSTDPYMIRVNRVFPKRRPYQIL